MSTSYEYAPEVLEVAHGLIRQHHQHLETAPIVYLFRDPPAKANGRKKWATVRVVSGLNAFLAMAIPDSDGLAHEGSFFALEVAMEVWKELSAEAKRALVDHELCRVGPGGRGSTNSSRSWPWVVVKRHGLWTTSVFDLVQAGAEQLALDLDRLDDQGEGGGR